MAGALRRGGCDAGGRTRDHPKVSGGRIRAMTAVERRAISLQIDVKFRFAEPEDLPKLEWYGQYTHFRRVFQRAYEDQLAGRRLMLLADVNGWPIGQIFVQLESLDDALMSLGRRGYLYCLPFMDLLQRCGIGTALIPQSQPTLTTSAYASLSIPSPQEN